MDDTIVFAISIVIYTSIITVGTMLIMFRFCRGIHKQRMERKISISTSGASNSPHSSRETHPAFHKLAYILFILTICGYWNHVAWAISGDAVVGTVDNVLYSAQSYLVTIFWVIRVYRSFEGSELQFSSYARFTINIFMALFGVFAMSGAVALFWTEQIDDNLTEHIVTILFILFFLSMFSTSGVFVYKLIRIYQKIMQNEKVIGTITKIVILNFASVLMTIINAVVYLTMFDVSDFGRYVHHYIMIFEFFVNFKCVTLSFHYYSKEYMKLCGPIHGTCNLCWGNCISPEVKLANMQVNSVSIGSTSDGSPRSQSPSDLEETTV